MKQLLPRDDWIVESAGEGVVLVGAWVDEEGWRHFEFFEPWQVPNEFVSADELEILSEQLTMMLRGGVLERRE